LLQIEVTFNLVEVVVVVVLGPINQEEQGLLQDVEQKYVQRVLEVGEDLDSPVVQAALLAAAQVIMEALVEVVDLHPEELAVVPEILPVLVDLTAAMVVMEVEMWEDLKEEQLLSTMMEAEHLYQMSGDP
jgi:hypothetical protein